MNTAGKNKGNKKRQTVFSLESKSRKLNKTTLVQRDVEMKRAFLSMYNWSYQEFSFRGPETS